MSILNNNDYLTYLYSIASLLNKEFSLHAILRKSLEKTAELLHMETGWIWLTEADNRSVYLAVSHNLPPALGNHPERLSGWCYCIKHYFSDEIDQAMNISEIACSRLEDIKSGTNDLKFHATIPIISNNQKVGLINLLSKETRKLSENELTLLNTISELVGTAIQRSRLYGSHNPDRAQGDTPIQTVSHKVILPRLTAIIEALESPDGGQADLLQQVKTLKAQLMGILKETENLGREGFADSTFNYPELPITKRELQVLELIRTGLTNEQIGQQLFITERTVKFHITSILSKLNAKNRTEAVDIGLRRGLLSN